MKCIVCGRDYVNVGVHAKRRHGLTADEYRVEFGLLMTAPLVDKALSEHLSRMAKIGMKADPSRKEMLAERCRTNAAAALGKKIDSRFTTASKQRIAESNARRNDAYLERVSSVVNATIRSGGTSIDVRRMHGVSHAVVKKLHARGVVQYSVNDARKESSKRAAETQMAKSIAALKMHYDAAENASDLCRLSGVGLTTYRRLVGRGLFQKKHRNSRSGVGRN